MKECCLTIEHQKKNYTEREEQEAQKKRGKIFKTFTLKQESIEIIKLNKNI